ncbi:hypothetical protein WJX73_009082 [Symbiochloris irregularis]|uniref:Septin-type G domain-containing protein n=1 Tax=Symbiochloris irregularis TaxID=706552 RepID=A0AAW1PGB9_9CHLO
MDSPDYEVVHHPDSPLSQTTSVTDTDGAAELMHQAEELSQQADHSEGEQAAPAAGASEGSHKPILTVAADQAFHYHVNILVIGGAGLGKTTFIKQIFADYDGHMLEEHMRTYIATWAAMSSFERNPKLLCRNLPEGVVTNTGDLVHYHVQYTPGHIADNGEYQALILKNIQASFDKQSNLMDPLAEQDEYNPGDHLYDMVLYFIAPHCFKLSDVDYIRKLSKVATVVPICAKADAMTAHERKEFQNQVRNQLTEGGLSDVLTCLDKEISEAKVLLGLDAQEQTVPPFAVICGAPSTGFGKYNKERVRDYIWGTCNTDDPDHSDFLLIKQVILGTAFHSLRNKKQAHFMSFWLPIQKRMKDFNEELKSKVETY